MRERSPMKDRRKSTGANITDAKKSRIADAMGDDAKPSMREKKFGKRARRRETQKQFRDALKRRSETGEGRQEKVDRR